MDAFAVSVGLGIKDTRGKLKLAISAAILFSVFQMLMPAIGWLLGVGFRNFISDYDHWVAFILLFFIGAKMIHEGVAPKCKTQSEEKTSNTALFILAVATSIDALAVGVSFAFLKISVVIPIFIIGAVTFVLCFFTTDPLS